MVENNRNPRTFEVKCIINAENLAEAELKGKMTAIYFVADMNSANNSNWNWSHLGCSPRMFYNEYDLYFIVHKQPKKITE